MPSVKLALDHVNENTDVLRNYRLHMWWNDTMVSKNFRKKQNSPLKQKINNNNKSSAKKLFFNS